MNDAEGFRFGSAPYAYDESLLRRRWGEIRSLIRADGTAEPIRARETPEDMLRPFPARGCTA